MMVCEQNEVAMYLGTILLFVMILGDLDEKIVLLMDAKRGYGVKLIMYIQIILAMFIL
jgi:hypothetical protein